MKKITTMMMNDTHTNVSGALAPLVPNKHFLGVIGLAMTVISPTWLANSHPNLAPIYPALVGGVMGRTTKTSPLPHPPRSK